MRPGHIKVFDGLRITTEHVNHLQGAMHSALQDIREILGLKKVYYGFEVAAENGQKITIHPGLAFDARKNRIACDEPRTLDVFFEPDEEVKFVCIKYDQVEGGEVEGQFTIVWDSCSVSLLADMPEPEEDLIPIAKLVRHTGEEGETLEVISLLFTQQNEEPSDASGEEEIIASEQTAEEIEIEPVAIETPTPLVIEEGDAPAGEENSTAAEPLPIEEENETESPPQTDATATASPAWRLRIQQGVTRLSAQGLSLGEIILGALKENLSGGDSSPDAELLFTLGEKELVLDFHPSSLSCQTMITAALATGESDSEEKPPAYSKCQSVSHGEATCARDKISQFGLSTISSYSNTQQTGACRPSSELTERGIAHLPLGALLKQDEISSTEPHPFYFLQLLIRADKTNGAGFKAICALLWKGAITEEIIRSIETQTTDFAWEILVAWKAMGEIQE